MDTIQVVLSYGGGGALAWLVVAQIVKWLRNAGGTKIDITQTTGDTAATATGGHDSSTETWGDTTPPWLRRHCAERHDRVTNDVASLRGEIKDLRGEMSTLSKTLVEVGTKLDERTKPRRGGGRNDTPT